MKPSQVSTKLRQIAAAIDNSKNPRRDLVALDLKKLVKDIHKKYLGGLTEENQELKDIIDNLVESAERAEKLQFTKTGKAVTDAVNVLFTELAKKEKEDRMHAKKYGEPEGHSWSKPWHGPES